VGLATIVALLGGAAVPATADDIERRWERPETAYADMNVPQKIGSNVRQGFVGLVDSVFQGAFSAFAVLSPWGGHASRKIGTFAGDVIGLVDDNIVTSHVFRGVLSRQLLRFGAGARGLPNGIALIHDTTFDVPLLDQSAFVDDRAFRPDVYVNHSIFATVGGVVLSNFLIRPAGSLITIFGARETGDSMHEFGVDLIEESLRVRFL
jgi:hypothetical protein